MTAAGDAKIPNAKPNRAPWIVASTTLLVFALARLGRPWILDALGVKSRGYGSLSELFLALYSWYWLPPLLLTTILFGRRRALAALGLNGNPAIGFAVAAVCTLPMAIGYAVTGQLTIGNQFLAQLTRSSLLPGTMEEILYRGLLFGLLFRFARWGFLPAAMIGAATFGAAHLWQGHSAAETAGVFVVTAFGAAWFAWLYIEWRANLWVPIAFHVAMNLYWDLFAMGETALGGLAANAFRAGAVALSIGITIVAARRRGGLRIRGSRWLHGPPAT